MTRCVTASVCGALAATLLTCQAADLYRVAGIVINSETGASLPRARVVVLRTGTTRVVATQTIGLDGRFGFELPQGKFNLLAGTRDVQTVVWDPNARQPHRNIDCHWPRS
jgi:hypothetical protein